MIDGYQVTIIGEEAFAAKDRKEYLTGHDLIVTLPNTITTIEDFAFYRAPVTTINIPLSTTSIGVGAFLVAPSTGTIRFNVDNGHPVFATIDGVLFNKTKRELLSYCHFNNHVMDYEVPKGIVSIAPYAFYNDYYVGIDGEGGEYDYIGIGGLRGHSVNRVMGTIKLPSTVTSIGRYAFSYNMCGVSMPRSVVEIGEGAFIECGGGYESEIVIPKQLEKIQDSTFMKATWNGVIPDSVTSIGDHAFQEAKCPAYLVRELVIPGSVKRIGDGAFQKSGEFSSVTIREGTVSIGNECFSGCQRLETVTLPASVTSFGKDAFDREKVTLVVEQGSYAQSYAIENGIKYQYANAEEDLSWLTGDLPSDDTEADLDWIQQVLDEAGYDADPEELQRLMEAAEHGDLDEETLQMMINAGVAF